LPLLWRKSNRINRCMGIDFDEICLTSQQILERISEEAIYEYFLNDSIKDGKLLKCCFHKDSNPSLGFYISSSNQLIHKCFGCGAQGNVFDFVSKLHTCNFGKTLNIIQNTFKLSKNYGNIPNNHIVANYSKQRLDKTKTQIIPTYRTWNKIDLDYWSRYSITLELLDRYNIRPSSRVYIVKKSGEYI